MGTLRDTFLFEVYKSPAKFPAEQFQFLVEFSFCKQPPLSIQRSSQFQRIDECVDKNPAKWLIDEVFECIPPCMKFMLFPNNDVADKGILQSTVHLVDAL